MAFVDRCPLRNEVLPRVPCDCSKCEWNINETDYKNCSWVLFEYFATFPRESPHPGLSSEEITKLTGCSESEQQKIFDEALSKLRVNLRSASKEFDIPEG